MSGNGAVGAGYGELLVVSLVVLGAVCVAGFVIVRLTGRLLATGRPRGAHLLDVVARLPLEPRRSLYVVEVAGKTLLVGTSEMGLSVLSELDGGQVRARVTERPSFGELVRTAWQRRRGLGAPGEPAAGDAGPDASAAAGPRATGLGASVAAERVEPDGRASGEARSAGRRGAGGGLARGAEPAGAEEGKGAR